MHQSVLISRQFYCKGQEILAKTKNMLHECYLIREAVENDKSEIIALQENYLQDETFHKSYTAKNKDKISPEEEERSADFIQASLENSIKQYPCLVSVHKESQKIAAMAILANEEVSAKSIANNTSSLKSKTEVDILSYINAMYEKANIPEKFPDAKKFIKLRYLAVHKDHGQKGLATSLIQESILWGKNNNFDLLFGTFSSIFAQKAARRAGLQSILDYDIRERRNSDGSLLFADVAPNNIISIMGIELKK